MSVLTFAVLSIKSPYTVDTPELKSSFKKVLQILNTASGCTYDLLHQIEDASILYLIGSWASIEVHEKYTASPDHGVLYESFKSLVNVEVAFHAGIDKSMIPLDAPCIAISRPYIKTGKNEEFESVWTANRHHIIEYTKPYSFVGGWRIDGAVGGEWLQFAGFQSVDHHYEFPKTERFKEYEKVMEFVGTYEVSHAKALGW